MVPPCRLPSLDSPPSVQVTFTHFLLALSPSSERGTDYLGRTILPSAEALAAEDLIRCASAIFAPLIWVRLSLVLHFTNPKIDRRLTLVRVTHIVHLQGSLFTWLTKIGQPSVFCSSSTPSALGNLTPASCPSSCLGHQTDALPRPLGRLRLHHLPLALDQAQDRLKPSLPTKPIPCSAHSLVDRPPAPFFFPFVSLHALRDPSALVLSLFETSCQASLERTSR